MKMSEVIRDLADFVVRYGDLEVKFYDGHDDDYKSINKVGFDYDRGFAFVSDGKGCYE